MRMLSKIVFAAVATGVVAGPALAEDGKERFVHEGYTYVYSVKDVKNAQLISGTRYPGGAAFRLRVADGKVVGTSGATKVAFNVEEARGAAATAE